MQGHFESVFLLDLPIRSKETGLRTYFEIATLGFDPGLKLKEEIRVDDASFFRKRNTKTGVMSRDGEPSFSFTAKVIRLEKALEIQDTGPETGLVDTLTLYIYLEIADKEATPEIIEAITKHNDNYEFEAPKNEPASKDVEPST